MAQTRRFPSVLTRPILAPAGHSSVLMERPELVDMFGEMVRQSSSAVPRCACALLIFGIASGLLAGCGNSGSSPAASSPPKYVAAADAICTSQLTLLNELPQPSTPDQAVSYLPKAITIIRRETGQLAAIRPAASIQKPFAAALGDARQLASVLARFLHQHRTGIVEVSTFGQVQAQSGALRAEVDAHFREAGLARCG